MSEIIRARELHTRFPMRSVIFVCAVAVIITTLLAGGTVKALSDDVPIAKDSDPVLIRLPFIPAMKAGDYVTYILWHIPWKTNYRLDSEADVIHLSGNLEIQINALPTALAKSVRAALINAFAGQQLPAGMRIDASQTSVTWTNGSETVIDGHKAAATAPEHFSKTGLSCRDALKRPEHDPNEARPYVRMIIGKPM
jgi:hypothetical protein